MNYITRHYLDFDGTVFERSIVESIKGMVEYHYQEIDYLTSMMLETKVKRWRQGYRFDRQRHKHMLKLYQAQLLILKAK